MKSFWLVVAVLSLGTTGCPDSSFPCTRYCWSHRQPVPDITDENMTGVPDGRFDVTCTMFSDLENWHPPLPPFGHRSRDPSSVRIWRDPPLDHRWFRTTFEGKLRESAEVDPPPGANNGIPAIGSALRRV